jgi:hypothetical protein
MEHAQTPQTIGRALDEYEAALFVGREDELATFSHWLDDPESPILNVHGRGGIGKSTLLRAFSRASRAQGRRVRFVDLDQIRDAPEAFWAALVPDAADPIRTVQGENAIVLIDSYARSPALAAFLQDELLTPLASGGKVVIAGRAGLGPNWRPWRALVRSIALDVLAENDARRYLLRRGVSHRPLIDSILRTAAGLPLALSLAADIVLELGAVDLSSTTEWHLAVRTLVDHLMHEVPDPELVRLLQACAVVHHFDEPTLAAMTDEADVSEAFARLCALSIVRAGEHGLSLHTDVRNAIADDLRWRNPDTYTALRERALDYLRHRMVDATQDERHWLSAERMFLWENAFLHSVLFQRSGGGDVTVTLGGSEDAEDVMMLERRYQDEVLPQQARVRWTLPNSLEGLLKWLSRALRMDGARLVLARDIRGRLTGYALSLPIYRAAYELLAEDPVHARVIEGIETYGVPIPARPDDAVGYYLVRLCVLDEEAEATNAALIADTLGLIAREGVYFTAAALPLHREVLTTLRFEPIEGAEAPNWLPDYPFQGYALDLRRVGFEAWIDALMKGREIVPRPDADSLERELTDLLPVFDDDAAVEASSLGKLAGDAAAARRLVGSAVSSLKATASSDLALALRAIELAYIDRAAAHERLAERLSVSRSTFYRLLRRGTRSLAEALSREPS